MFSGLSILQTFLFLLTIGVLFFSIPVYGYIQKRKSPILFSYIHSVSVDEKTIEPIEEMTLYYTNITDSEFCIEKIGAIPKETEWRAIEKNAILWFFQNSDDVRFPIILSSKKRGALRLQKPIDLSPLQLNWIFKIDGIYYRTDSDNYSYAQKINIA